MDVAVTGSTGLIGTALLESLRAAGHSPLPIVRGTPGPGALGWDPETGTIDAAGLEGVDAVVHLAGAGIGDHRWTDEYKRTVRESRQKGTSLIATTLAGLQRPPQVLLSQSGINYYGDRGDAEVTERTEAGEGFLANVCVVWEAATQPAADAGIRVVRARTAQVLTPKGGGLKKQLRLFRLGLGGRFGRGRQWQSWIGLDDEIAVLLHLLTSDVSGPVNVCTPNPVRNAEFAATLGRVLGRPAIIPVPAFGPKLVLGSELADALLFESVRAVPEVLAGDGFTFTHPTLEVALRSLLDRPLAA